MAATKTYRHLGDTFDVVRAAAGTSLSITGRDGLTAVIDVVETARGEEYRLAVDGKPVDLVIADDAETTFNAACDALAEASRKPRGVLWRRLSALFDRLEAGAPTSPETG